MPLIARCRHLTVRLGWIGRDGGRWHQKGLQIGPARKPVAASRAGVLDNHVHDPGRFIDTHDKDVDRRS